MTTFSYTPKRPTQLQPLIDRLLAGEALCGRDAVAMGFKSGDLSGLVKNMREAGLHFAVEKRLIPTASGKQGPPRIYYRVVEEHEATPTHNAHEKTDWIKGQLQAGKELCDADVAAHFGTQHSVGGRLAAVRVRMEKDGHRFASRVEQKGKQRLRYWRLQTPGEDGEAPLPVVRNGKAHKPKAKEVMPYGMPDQANPMAIQAPQLGQILGVYLTHLDDDGEVTIGLRTAGGRYLFKMIGAETG